MRTALLRPLVLAILVAFAASPTPRIASAQPASAVTDDPLLALNTLARADYRDAKSRAITDRDPVLVVTASTVVTRYNGLRNEHPLLPPLYTALKTYDHIPLGIHAVLFPAADTLDTARRAALSALRGRISAAHAPLATLACTPAQRTRQSAIVDASLAFIDRVLARGGIARAEWVAFDRAMAPALMANANDATREALTALHAVVTAWRAEIGPDAWARVRVVVTGSHMAREENAAMQYFARLLGEPREGGRIVYAEGIADEAQALDLLATHTVDRDLGVALFDDPLRMHRDLLGDAAAAFVPTLLPTAATPPPRH